jgi:putative two-component system hydrogenase maturation factor HypX/HoxX
MKILLLCHAFNSLTQRLFVELKDLGHEVSVEFDINDAVSEEAVQLFQPDIIIAPYLKRAIPASIWQHHTCLIVHPGIIGDRGPSALDWAILNNVPEWGVTVLQANAVMDAGDIWASRTFAMRAASKASLYRNEVTEAAVSAVLEALAHFNDPEFKPLPLAEANGQGCWQAAMQQQDRSIDWQVDNTDTVLRKIRSADGFPGVRCELSGREVYLFDAHPAEDQHGEAGQIITHDDHAICVATVDGAVWIGHLKDRQVEHPFKLPAARVLGASLNELPSPTDAQTNGYERIQFTQRDNIGYLAFDFYNGAMSSDDCRALQQAIQLAKQLPIKLLILLGGPDYWSNGMHLNHIEAADSAADESWANINAIDDLALEIIDTPNQYVVSMLRGNAGAGGVFLARAADELWARKGVIINPHYKDMGNLYGSEYWTYQLPRFAGADNVERITQSRLPMGMHEATRLGLVDKVIDAPRPELDQRIQAQALALLQQGLDSQLEQKRRQRASDESTKALAAYRNDELQHMRRNFYGFDPSYHVARYNFVYKIPKSHTPLTLASHRRKKHSLRKVS